MSDLKQLENEIDEKNRFFDAEYLSIMRSKKTGDEEATIRLIFDEDSEDNAVIVKLTPKDLRLLKKDIPAALGDIDA